MNLLLRRTLLCRSRNRVITDGSNGNYFTTPDSVPLSITGANDLDMRWFGALNDWTPAADSLLMGKWLSSGNQKSFYLKITATTGLPALIVTTDGINGITFAATAAPTVSDYALLGIRATLDVDNGASGKTATFYTSRDFINWTQLGNTVTFATAISLFDSTAPFTVNSIENGGFGTVNGYCRQAQLFSGINGTKVADFDLSRYVSGPNLRALTGEVYTMARSGSPGTRLAA